MFLSYINTLSSAILSYSSITFRGKVILSMERKPSLFFANI